MHRYPRNTKSACRPACLGRRLPKPTSYRQGRRRFLREAILVALRWSGHPVTGETSFHVATAASGGNGTVAAHAARGAPEGGTRRIGRFKPRLADACRDLLRDRGVPRIVIGLLSSPSGIGQSARLAATALKNDGYRVLGHDLGRYFHEVAGNIAHGIPDASGWRGPAHVLLVVGAPYAPFALGSIGRDFLKEKLVTGYWAWELTRVPRSWERGLPVVHEIAVPSLFTANAVCTLGAGQPVRVCPHPVALDHPPLSPFATGAARPDQPFTVVSTLSVGSGFERKNPVALIRAFRLAFGDRKDRRLRMLVTAAEHYAPARTAILRAVGRARNIQIAWKPLTRPDSFNGGARRMPTPCCTGPKASACRWPRRCAQACRWWQPAGPATWTI